MSQVFIVLQQCSAQAMAYCPSLTTASTAFDCCTDVYFIKQFCLLKWLPNNHSCGFSVKKFVQWLFVNSNLAFALLNKNTSCGCFSPACTVEDFRCHN
ncbi:uncharacterized protein METZ01_LOCUS86956 [marine metagenome]|uniref:Uncharacterized protein n=1 Tax=marine metagenome TaxID=408172 RepID=A0A381V150_9ZZZZ